MDINLEYTFRVKKRLLFTVRYGPYCGSGSLTFTTGAYALNFRRSAFVCCGRCQDDYLPNTSLARCFYVKWDPFHLCELSSEELAELMTDIEQLKHEYPYIEGSDFSEMVALDREWSRKGQRTR